MIKLEFKETEHDYYCSDENYFKGDTKNTYNSWNEFKESNFYLSEDFNLLFRYDICQFYYEDVVHIKTLKLYFVLQRKGFFVPAHVYIKEKDLPEIEKFLNDRFEYLKKLWQ